MLRKSLPTFSGATAASSQPSHSAGAPGANAAARGPASRICHTALASPAEYKRMLGGALTFFRRSISRSAASVASPALSAPNSTSKNPPPAGSSSSYDASFKAFQSDRTEFQNFRNVVRRVERILISQADQHAVLRTVNQF